MALIKEELKLEKESLQGHKVFSVRLSALAKRSWMYSKYHQRRSIFSIKINGFGLVAMS